MSSSVSLEAIVFVWQMFARGKLTVARATSLLFCATKLNYKVAQFWCGSDMGLKMMTHNQEIIIVAKTDAR